MNQNPDFKVHLTDPSSKQELDQVAHVINTAFKRQTVHRQDCNTITVDNLKTKIPVIPKEIASLYNGEEIIGTLILHLPLSSHIAIISHLAILPSYQGQKLGKSLMHFGEQRAANTHSKKQSRINLISHPIDTQEGLTRYFEALNYNFLFEEKPPTNQLKLFLPEYNPKIILKYFEKNLLRKASV